MARRKSIPVPQTAEDLEKLLWQLPREEQFRFLDHYGPLILARHLEGDVEGIPQSVRLLLLAQEQRRNLIRRKPSYRERDAEMLRRHEEEGRKERELAEDFDMTAAAVSQALKRARRRRRNLPQGGQF